MTTALQAELEAMYALLGYNYALTPRTLDFVELVLSEHPSTVVEIGVQRGCSLFTHALALRYLGTTATAVGIDAWQLAPTLEGADRGNLVRRRRDKPSNQAPVCFNALARLKLNPWAALFAGTSDQYASQFRPGTPAFIDILHIDGNHAAAPVMRDTTNFLPLVKPGGHIWFDDDGWTEDGVDTVKPAITHALLHCDFLFTRNGHALLRKHP